jgi:uncharacterized membrane protein (DUF4010 family)
MAPVEDYEPFVSIALALGVGLLIGLQRQQSASQENTKGLLGGARTFPLFALAGALSMLVSRQAGTWVVGLAFAGLSVPIVIAYADDVRKEKDRGLTTEVSFVLTFLLGALAASDGVVVPHSRKVILVSACGVAVTALLSLKTPLHRWAEKISQDDIIATVKFLVLAVIVLPFLPDEGHGPYGVLNPFHIGLMVVFIAGISFVGYAVVRILGPGRGLVVTGLLGGLVSSTAVTLSVSHRARREPAVAGACAVAVVLASTVMLLRVVIVVATVNSALLLRAAIPLGAMVVAAVLSSFLLYRRAKSTDGDGEEVKLKNPFELGPALKFAILFTGILLGVKAVEANVGERGLYVAAVVAGLADVDAITLSMSKLAREGTAADVAVTGILLGIASNTVVKGVLAVFLGGWIYGRKVLIAFAATLIAGAAGMAYLWMTASGLVS